MELKEQLLQLLQNADNPNEIRLAMKSPSVSRKFESVGVAIQIYELHSPSATAKKKSGFGITLCGRRRSMRNDYVTCKKCLAKLKK